MPFMAPPTSAGNRAIERVVAAYEAGDLLCLKSGTSPTEVGPLAPRLAIENTKGEAGGA